eukprot:5984952-Lingulodinium_polyedra.AAC.1
MSYILNNAGGHSRTLCTLAHTVTRRVAKRPARKRARARNRDELLPRRARKRGRAVTRPHENVPFKSSRPTVACPESASGT